MHRSLDPELIDDPDFPPAEMARVHRDLARIHRILGTHATVERFLNIGGKPLRRILDIGCGDGALLLHLRQRLNAEVIGIDPHPAATGGSPPPVPVLRRDATRDDLPAADVAICSLVSHHLTPEQNIAMIRNVSRSCPRFVILDLVRHRLPLCLFTAFVCPLVGRIAALDGRQSIRRAYTPAEFSGMVAYALEGKGSFSLDVSPWRSRQVADIRYSA